MAEAGQLIFDNSAHHGRGSQSSRPWRTPLSPPAPGSEADHAESGEDEAGGLGSRRHRSQLPLTSVFGATYVLPRDCDARFALRRVARAAALSWRPSSQPRPSCRRRDTLNDYRRAIAGFVHPTDSLSSGSWSDPLPQTPSSRDVWSFGQLPIVPRIPLYPSRRRSIVLDQAPSSVAVREERFFETCPY